MANRRNEAADPRSYDRTVQGIEDSIAVMLTARDDLHEHWLWLRAKERRGAFDPDDAAQAQRTMASARRGIDEGLRLARALRADPLGERRGEGGGNGG